MALQNILFKRLLNTQPKANISQIFAQDDIQRLLVDITRFEEKRIFARHPVRRLKAPQLMFMTNKQLEKAKQDAYERAKARLQMPPVMEPDTSEPKVLARDEEIVGYTKFKIMFIDISPGYSNRNRLMSVRETDGTLRYPTHEERSRMNHIFYPHDLKSIDPPKLFEEKNLLRLLQKREYVHVLDRACFQFEPDDPRYVEITRKVYDYIDGKNDYDKLRSTRHFGPMSLYLAYDKRADDLILEMISKKLIADAAKLVKIYNACHNIETNQDLDDISILKEYAELSSSKKYNLDLALQELQSKDRKSSGQEDAPETSKTD